METQGVSRTTRSAVRAPGRATYVATLLAAIAGAVVLALAATPAFAATEPSAQQGARAAAHAAPADAAGQLATLRRLRDTAGQELQGIAHAARYLALTPPADAEVHDAIGQMAERLAQRASGSAATAADRATLDGAGAHGVHFFALPREGGERWCHDGAAWRRTLAQQPDAPQQARALLALTRPDCIDPALAPTARRALDAWRADVLDLPWPRGYDALPAAVKSRLHVRRAGLWAVRAQQMALAGRPMRAAAERAQAELASVQPAGLDDDDRAELAEATVLVEAARRGAERATTLARASARGLRLVVHAGAQPGQTCVLLFAAEPAESAGAVPAGETAAAPQRLAERCTFGRVWPHSAALQPASRTLSLAVQAPDGRVELWVFRAEAPAGAARGRLQATPWRVDVLPGTTAAPQVAQQTAQWSPRSPQQGTAAQ